MLHRSKASSRLRAPVAEARRAEKDEADEQKDLFLKSIQQFKDDALVVHVRGRRWWHNWSNGRYRPVVSRRWLAT